MGHKADNKVNGFHPHHRMLTTKKVINTCRDCLEPCQLPNQLSRYYFFDGKNRCSIQLTSVSTILNPRAHQKLSTMK